MLGCCSRGKSDTGGECWAYSTGLKEFEAGQCSGAGAESGNWDCRQNNEENTGKAVVMK